MHFKGHVMLFEFLIKIRRKFLNYLHFYNAKRWSHFIINLIFYLNLTIAELTYATSGVGLAILSNVYYTIMDILLSIYGLINSVNTRPYLLSKMSITVLLYSKTIYERYLCVQSMVSCLEYQRVFMRFTLARRVFIASLLFDVALFWRAFRIYWKGGREGFRGTRICWKRSFPVNIVWQFMDTW